MSLADELKVAKAKMEASKKSPATKPKKATRSAVVWKREDEIIALYLLMSNSSNFMVENYSSKRDISKRNMSAKMTKFKSLIAKKPDATVTEQMQSVYAEYANYEIRDFQKVVISILKNNANHAVAGNEVPEQAVLRREGSEG